MRDKIILVDCGQPGLSLSFVKGAQGQVYVKASVALSDDQKTSIGYILAPGQAVALRDFLTVGSFKLLHTDEGGFL